MARPGGFAENLGVNLQILAGATVDYQSNNSLLLTSNELTITVRGEMDLFYGINNNNTLIDGGAANPLDYINVDGGFLGYYGRQNITDTITVPIAVQNSGTFRVSVSSNSGKDLAGTLIVVGANASTHNVSVYLTGASSSVQLANYDTLVCANDYYQDSGTLETTDETPCTLETDFMAADTVTIAGGTVWIDNPGAGTYGVLNVNTPNLNFSGNLNVSVAGNTGSPGTSDLLNVDGTTKLLQGSSLFVNVKGQPTKDDTWKIIQDRAGNFLQGNFFDIGSSPPGSVGSGEPNQKDLTQYILDGPNPIGG
jgi:hypothetical protein